MTHPLTPREMIELKPCPFCGGSPEMEFSEFELHDGFHVVCVGDKNCPLYCSEPYRAHDTEKEAAEVWNRRTALASGSGDHAELARDLRAFEGSDDLGNGDFTVCEFAADALDSLLAEIAALRGNLTKTERDYTELRDSYDAIVNKLGIERTHGSRETKRATEAERKLDEAVGLLREAIEPYEHISNVRAFEVMENGPATRLVAIRTFLSKEAERG